MVVVFIGGLSTGRIALEYLLDNKYVTVPFVITYPEEGDRKPIQPNIRGGKSFTLVKDLVAERYIQEIRNFNPDLILVAGWSRVLPKQLIDIPPLGTIGFHPSLLPNDRGRSVLAWQIEEGYEESGLTMFYYNENPDCGDIIAQEKFTIEPNDYLNDVLRKCDSATYNIMRAYFPLIRKNLAPRKPQHLSEGNFRRLRTENDSLIDWNSNGKSIYNKIRAISEPYPGAYFTYKGRKVRVWKAIIFERNGTTSMAQEVRLGEILQKNGEYLYLVQCRDSVLEIQTDTVIDV